MSTVRAPLGLFIAVTLLLGGCAAVNASPRNVTPAPTMSPGMLMAPGESMPGIKSNATAPSTTGIVKTVSPSKSAKMICESETRSNVGMLLGLAKPPQGKATWANHLYTCTYQLSVGPLLLSVKESPDIAAARAYFDAMRAHLGHTKPLTGLAGLGLPAYENSTGLVVFLKDNMTLQVNATALPRQIGPDGSSPAELAYTIATDVLACWTGK
jgi:hypothetical protein